MRRLYLLLAVVGLAMGLVGCATTKGAASPPPVNPALAEAKAKENAAWKKVKEAEEEKTKSFDLWFSASQENLSQHRKLTELLMRRSRTPYAKRQTLEFKLLQAEIASRKEWLNTSDPEVERLRVKMEACNAAYQAALDVWLPLNEELKAAKDANKK